MKDWYTPNELLTRLIINFEQLGSNSNFMSYSSVSPFIEITVNPLIKL